MKIYNVTVGLYDYAKSEERDEDVLFVLDDSEDPQEFADLLYTPLGCEVLRFDSKEIPESNVKMSKNVLKSHAKKYISLQ
jgi:hypothetical protein